MSHLIKNRVRYLVQDGAVYKISTIVYISKPGARPRHTTCVVDSRYFLGVGGAAR